MRIVVSTKSSPDSHAIKKKNTNLLRALMTCFAVAGGEMMYGLYA